MQVRLGWCVTDGNFSLKAPLAKSCRGSQSPTHRPRRSPTHAAGLHCRRQGARCAPCTALLAVPSPSIAADGGSLGGAAPAPPHDAAGVAAALARLPRFTPAQGGREKPCRPCWWHSAAAWQGFPPAALVAVAGAVGGSAAGAGLPLPVMAAGCFVSDVGHRIGTSVFPHRWYTFLWYTFLKVYKTVAIPCIWCYNWYA